MSELSRDEIRRLRLSSSEADDAASLASEATGPGNARVPARTFEVKSYPTEPNAFYACRPLIVDGEEYEGATLGTTDVTGDDAVIYAANLGDAVPPAGTQVDLTYVPYRWVFTYNSDMQQLPVPLLTWP
jgi:hypothetical protein